MGYKNKHWTKLNGLVDSSILEYCTYSKILSPGLKAHLTYDYHP